jgi:hypothetical protein
MDHPSLSAVDDDDTNINSNGHNEANDENDININSNDDDDVDSEEANVHRSDDRSRDSCSLSSVDTSIDTSNRNGEGNTVIGNVNGNSDEEIIIIVPRCMSQTVSDDDDDDIWGIPETPLYEAMKELTLTTTMEGDKLLRLETPSAAKAEELSNKLHNQINNLITNAGNDAQKERWKNSSNEKQFEWIASFFLSSMLHSKTNQDKAIDAGVEHERNEKRGNDDGGSDDDDGDNNRSRHDDNNDDSDSDDWGKEELIFPSAPSSPLQSATASDGGGDEYWDMHIENTVDSNNRNTAGDDHHNNTSLQNEKQQQQQQQQQMFLVDMTQLDPEIHCKFDKNGVNDVTKSRRLRKQLEQEFTAYKCDPNLLAGGTVVPCSSGVWKAALIRLRDERKGHYLCPIFEPTSSAANSYEL